MCTTFTGTLTDVRGSWVRLGVLTFGLTGAPADYRLTFTTNTTGHPMPSTVGAAGLLSAAYPVGGALFWDVGYMDPAEVVEYTITKVGGGSMVGSVTMRAFDRFSPSNVWDVTMACGATRLWTGASMIGGSGGLG